MNHTALKRKTPLKSRKGLATNSTLKRSPMQRKKTAKARAKEFKPNIRRIVMDRSGGMCERCKLRRIAHLHHATYRSQNGTSDLGNAIGLCITCHELAHAKREVRSWCVAEAKRLAAYDESEVMT